MKKKQFLSLIIFTSAGVFVQTAIANDVQLYQKNRDTSFNQQGKIINEPSGADSAKAQKACLQKASDLIGASVRDQQDEKIGTIKDLMVDFRTSQAPFAVLSSGGF